MLQIALYVYWLTSMPCSATMPAHVLKCLQGWISARPSFGAGHNKLDSKGPSYGMKNLVSAGGPVLHNHSMCGAGIAMIALAIPLPLAMEGLQIT